MTSKFRFCQAAIRVFSPAACSGLCHICASLLALFLVMPQVGDAATVYLKLGAPNTALNIKGVETSVFGTVDVTFIDVQPDESINDILGTGTPPGGGGYLFPNGDADGYALARDIGNALDDYNATHATNVTRVGPAGDTSIMPVGGFVSTHYHGWLESYNGTQVNWAGQGTFFRNRNTELDSIISSSKSLALVTPAVTVPEPSSWILLLTALITIRACFARR